MKKEELLKIIKNNNMKNSYVLATFYNKVCLGHYEEDIIFEEEVDYYLCTEIRIFNKEAELRINKYNDKIYYKLITDKEYNDSLKDEYMFINGIEGKRLRVRNYLDIDDLKQVNITESRLVDICLVEEQ